MATQVAAAVDGRCPLCDETILSVNAAGHIVTEETHPIPLYAHGRAGEGYMLCDGCGFLAELNVPLTLN